MGRVCHNAIASINNCLVYLIARNSEISVTSSDVSLLPLAQRRDNVFGVIYLYLRLSV